MNSPFKRLSRALLPLALAAGLMFPFPAFAQASGAAPSLTMAQARKILADLDDLGNFPGKDYTALFTIVSEDRKSVV